MNSNDLPSPYELARIAAALRGRAAEKKPAEAAEHALALWQSAASVLREEKMKLQKQEAIDNLASEQTTQSAAKLNAKQQEQQHLAKYPDDEEILIRTSDGQSPAMEWINKQEGSTRDKFKTKRSFWSAWAAFDGMRGPIAFAKGVTGPVTATIEELRKFLAAREEKRRTADREGKRGKSDVK
jgi:hypothetical protein